MFNRAAGYGCVSYIGYYHVFDLVEAIVLIVEIVFVFIGYSKVGVEQNDEGAKVFAGIIGTEQFHEA